MSDLSQDKNKLLRTLIALLSGNSSGGGSGLFIPVTDTFTQALARLGLQPAVTYAFGSAVTPSPGVTPITSSTDLAANFHNYQDVDGLPIPLLNGQLERYQDFSASANFVFAPSSLNLTATLDPGGTTTIVGDTIPGGVGGLKVDGSTANNFANFAVLSPATVTVGRLLAVQFTGLYFVNSVTGSTSFTLTAVPNSGVPTAPVFGPKGLALLPAYIATTNAAYLSGTHTLSFASVPSGVTNGMSVSADFNNTGAPQWFGQSYVTNIAGGTVTLDNGTTQGFPSGSHVFFTPPIRSGQLWLQNYYGVGFNNVEVAAFETYCQVPGPTASFSGTNPALQPSTSPYGNWPATWIFSGAGGIFDDASEIDLLEEFGESNYGSQHFSCSLGGAVSAPVWVYKNKTPPYVWDAFHNVNVGFDLSLAPHRWQLIWTPNYAYRYFDGTLMAIDQFVWSSGQAAQYGANLSAGSINKSFAGNFLFPFNDACFPYSFNVITMSVWTLQA